MNEYKCLGNCDACTLECAMAEIPKDESDFDFEDDSLEQKYWGCVCVCADTPPVVLRSDAGPIMSQSGNIVTDGSVKG